MSAPAGPAAPGRVLRTGYTLTLSSALTAGIGLGFWVFAAHLYDPATLGRNSAAISAMMLIGGISQLNLMSSLTRFVPVSGAATRTLVLRVYGISAAVSLLLGGGFIALLGAISPRLLPLLGNPRMAAVFILSTLAWTTFVLQDSVLTALHRAPWVAGENTIFALVKLGVVVALAGALPRVGIFASWSAGLAVALLVTNAYLFRRAIPAHAAGAGGAAPVPTGRAIARFASVDVLGALCWIGSTTVLPIVVLNELGASASAYFSMAWLIAYSLYLVSANMGTSLVVETASDPDALRARTRQVMLHTLKLVSAAAIALVVAAPAVLAAFGGAYGRSATELLRLLALSAIPNVVTATEVAAARAALRAGRAGAILAGLCGSVVVLTAVLIPHLGIAGVGVAWLLAQTATAAVLLVAGGRAPAVVTGWLIGAPSRLAAGRFGDAIRSAEARPGVRAVLALRHARSARADAAILRTAADAAGIPPGAALRVLATSADIAVGGTGSTVLKVARTERGADQLRVQRHVLDALGAEPRLLGSRHLIPRVLDHGRHPREWALESALPGVDGVTLLAGARRGGPAREAGGPAAATGRAAVAAARAAIEPLHLMAQERAVDSALLERWVDDPVAALAGLPDARLAAADRRRLLGAHAAGLHEALTGVPVRVGWVHGDLCLSNVLYDAGTVTVTGIVDWADAAPDGLAALDAVHLALTTEAHVRHRELGWAVLRAMEPRWLDDRGLAAPGIASHHLVTLCWLGHLGNNLRKADQYGSHRYWIAANVDAVLIAGAPLPATLRRAST